MPPHNLFGYAVYLLPSPMLTMAVGLAPKSTSCVFSTFESIQHFLPESFSGKKSAVMALPKCLVVFRLIQLPKPFRAFSNVSARLA